MSIQKVIAIIGNKETQLDIWINMFNIIEIKVNSYCIYG